jgi:acyl-CoA dehydrogenase
MYFHLSGKKREIKRAAFEFVKREFDKDLALELERRHVFPEQIHKRGCQLGFIGVHYPEPYGGQGYGVLENSLVVEEFCRGHSGIGIGLRFQAI